MSRASEPSAPSIFGRPMVLQSHPEEGELYVLALTPGYEPSVAVWEKSEDEAEEDGAEGWAGHFSEDVEIECGVTADDCARAIERRLLDIAIGAAEFLDDAAKRELVKAAGVGLEHFPECKDEAESEAEPVL